MAGQKPVSTSPLLPPVTPFSREGTAGAFHRLPPAAAQHAWWLLVGDVFALMTCCLVLSFAMSDQSNLSVFKKGPRTESLPHAEASREIDPSEADRKRIAYFAETLKTQRSQSPLLSSARITRDDNSLFIEVPVSSAAAFNEALEAEIANLATRLIAQGAFVQFRVFGTGDFSAVSSTARRLATLASAEANVPVAIMPWGGKDNFITMVVKVRS